MVGGSSAAPQPAAASGLLQFPVEPQELKNTYYLVRAGESEAEAEGYVLTNPVAKTSMLSGLSRNGKRQVFQSTVRQLRDLGVDSPDWIWPSITQNAYMTAEILGALMGVGRSRIVPEFSFLDARGVGELERLPPSQVSAALAAGDALAATWRPGRSYDGTVHESSADVLVRVRQLMSLLETQYVGSSVVIVSPDSDNLSVLQAGVLGVDLRSHHIYAFAPGEVRRMQLSGEARPKPPSSLACPRPPQCV